MLRSLILVIALTVVNMLLTDARLSQIRLCVAGPNALLKCQAMSRALYARNFYPTLYCVGALSEYECMRKIASSEADVVNLDSGHVYTAGVRYSLMPILAESYGPESNYLPSYTTVAVIRSNLNVRSLADLKGLKSCHPGVGTSAGWIIPLGVLFEQKLIPSDECDNPVISLSKFFNESCAPNALDKHNNLGFNPSSVCNLCKNTGRGFCTSADPYSGEAGAFECLREGGGDIAFVRDFTPIQMTKMDAQVNMGVPSHGSRNLDYPGANAFHNPFLNYGNAHDYMLLCLNGEKKAITEYQNCNWGYVPGKALMILTSQLEEDKHLIKQFFLNASKVLGIDEQPSPFDESNFRMFDSKRFAGRNLIFSDDTQKLITLEGRDTFKSYLGDYEKIIQGMTKCEVGPLNFCVISRAELEKCLHMKAASAAKRLMNGIHVGCLQARTKHECMQMIESGEATISLFEAGDVYLAGRRYNLIPVLAEDYGLGMPVYRAVAVKKIQDQSTNLLHMKDKRTCHSAYKDGGGWYAPLAFLRAQMRSEGSCDSASYANVFFQSSCAPGVLTDKYIGNVKLCQLCNGTGENYCQKNVGEPYYGDSGALRCLEDKGQVAFLRHTTVWDNSANRNTENWARTIFLKDFELLCTDGSTAGIERWNTCNLGAIPSDALMISARRTAKEREAIVKFFLTAQEFFGAKVEGKIYDPRMAGMGGHSHYRLNDNFKLFVSEPLTKNVLFNDATVKLLKIPENMRTYDRYLGSDFLNLVEIVTCGSPRSHLPALTLRTLLVMGCILTITLQKLF